MIAIAKDSQRLDTSHSPLRHSLCWPFSRVPTGGFLSGFRQITCRTKWSTTTHSNRSGSTLSRSRISSRNHSVVSVMRPSTSSIHLTDHCSKLHYSSECPFSLSILYETRKAIHLCCKGGGYLIPQKLIEIACVPFSIWAWVSNVRWYLFTYSFRSRIAFIKMQQKGRKTVSHTTRKPPQSFTSCKAQGQSEQIVDWMGSKTKMLCSTRIAHLWRVHLHRKRGKGINDINHRRQSIIHQ